MCLNFIFIKGNLLLRKFLRNPDSSQTYVSMHSKDIPLGTFENFWNTINDSKNLKN